MYQQPPPLTVSDIFDQPFDKILVRSDSVGMENNPNALMNNAYHNEQGPMRDSFYNGNGHRSFSPRSFDNRAPSHAPASNNHLQVKKEPDWTSKGYPNPYYLHHGSDRQTDLQASRRLNPRQKFHLTKIYIEGKDGVNWTDVTNEFNADRSRGQVAWSEADVVTAFETMVNGTSLPDGRGKQAQSDIEDFWARHIVNRDNRNAFSMRRLTSFQIQIFFDLYCSSEGKIDWTSLVQRFNKKKPPQMMKWDEIELVTAYETFTIGAYLSNCHECRAQARKNITRFWRNANRAQN